MKKKHLHRILIPVLLAIIAFSAFQIIRIITEYRTAEDVSDSMLEFVSTVPSQTEPPEEVPATQPSVLPPLPNRETEPPEEPTGEPVEYPEVDFEGLLEVNDEVVGWILIEGSRINYPIVQGEDNQFYISHMADRRSNAGGSIFMDYRNTPDFSDRHTVIYGHNMRNGSMFASLTYYKNADFYKKHTLGKIMTPEGNFQFEVIAGYVASVEDKAWKVNFEDDEEFEAWLQTTMERSTLKSDIVPTADDRILTLSTCTYEFSNARYVLICRILP